MKPIKTKAILWYNAIIALLLSILGYSTACTMVADEYGSPPAPAYGVPTATFKVKGNISSLTDNKSITGIKVKMEWDSTYSDNQGNFEVSTNANPGPNNFSIQFNDVDGAENGAFTKLDTVVEFKDPIFTDGSGSWDAGTTETTFDVKMKPLE